MSASGKIQARTQVNISSDVMGRITDLAVDEGQRVKKGQFLMQVDPRTHRTAGRAVAGGPRRGAVAARSVQGRASSSARENLNLSRDNLRRQKELWAQQLTTRESLDRAENEVKVREAQLREQEQELSTQDQRIREMQATLSAPSTTSARRASNRPSTASSSDATSSRARRSSSAR